MRICVIIPTYKRTKRGISGPPLRGALESLRNQTFKDFRVYVSGDHYDDEPELASICDDFVAAGLDIVCTNSGPGEHFRGVLAGDRRKLWCVGGAGAIKRAVDRAMLHAMDWYFHLDDDDSWSPGHIQTYVNCIQKFPGVSFVVSKTKLGGAYIPRQRITDVYPNNYRPKECDSIHASWAIKLATLGPTVSAHYAEECEWAFGSPEKIVQPSDARLLGKFREMKSIETVCLPSVTVHYSGDSLHEKKL